ncbi:MAG: PAS domain-containing protein [Deferribacteraceae bacterium]|jgi:PAS domain S-box-containing protein|nr:PAS domain-containing protein [Deferribacteraceae bacterium]
MRSIFTYKTFAAFVALVFFVCSTYAAISSGISVDIRNREQRAVHTVTQLLSFEGTLKSAIGKYQNRSNFTAKYLNEHSAIDTAILTALTENNAFYDDVMRGIFITDTPVVNKYAGEDVRFATDYYEQGVQYYIFQHKLTNGRFLVFKLAPQEFIEEAGFAPYRDGIRIAFKDAISGELIAGSEELFLNNDNTLKSVVHFNGGAFELASLAYSGDNEYEKTVFKLLLWLFIVAGTLFLYVLTRFIQRLVLRKNAYAKLFYSSSAGMFNINPKTGIIQSINDQAAIILGYDSSTSVANKFVSLYNHIADYEVRAELAKELMESGYIHNKGVHLLKKDGSRLWVLLSMRMSSSSICSCLLVDADEKINLYRRVMVELNDANFVIGNIPAALLLFDEEGKAVNSNIFAQIMLGKTSREILGKTSAEIFPSDIGEAMYQEDQEVLKTAQSLAGQEVRFATFGQEKKAYLIYKIVRNPSEDGIKGLLYFMVDVSIRRLAEESVERKSEELAGIESDIKAVISSESEKLLAAEQFAFYKAKLTEMADTLDAIRFTSQDLKLYVDRLKPTIDPIKFNVYDLLKDVFDLVSPLLKTQEIDIHLAPLAREYIGRVTLKGYANELRQTITTIVLGMRNNILLRESGRYTINMSIAVQSFNMVITIEDNSGSRYEDMSDEPLMNILENVTLYSAKLLIRHEMRGELSNRYTEQGVKCVITLPNTL